MKTNQYLRNTKRMEELLALLSEQGKLNKKQQAELDEVSDFVADYEEANYPFKPDSLIEMIELRMFQRKLKQKDLAKLLGLLLRG